jgi:hypothetical protein
VLLGDTALPAAAMPSANASFSQLNFNIIVPPGIIELFIYHHSSRSKGNCGKKRKPYFPKGTGILFLLWKSLRQFP